MGRSVNWGDVQDSSLLPADLYIMEVEELTEGTSKNGNKLQYRAVFRVVEPAAFAGTPLFDYYTIGTDDDPTADEPTTWTNSIGVRRMKRLFKATGIPLSSDVDECVNAATGQKFVAQVQIEVDDGNRDPKYKGTQRNRIAAMYGLGERQVGTPAAAPKAGASKPAAASPAAKPIKCGTCGEMVPRADYMKHVNEQHPDE